MFTEPGDLIAGRDGREWLVLAVDHAANTLTLWNEVVGAWSGTPSGTFKILLGHEERAAANALQPHFPNLRRQA